MFPDFEKPLRLLLADLAGGAQLSLDIDALTIVAVSAHGRSVASVRGFSSVAIKVVRCGTPQKWELALRPRFFLGATPMQRLTTLAHELLHLHPRGGLRPEHAHDVVGKSGLDDDASCMAERFAAAHPIDVLGHDGPVRLSSWLVRPIHDTARRSFDDKDLFVDLVMMRTATRYRSTWW